MPTDVKRPTKASRSAATQRRLLDAAFEEFHEHGLAGGRVDRIAERARANKRLIYVYFGDKNGLFDAVVARDIEALVDAVPFTASDLPEYAVALMDWLYDRPAVIRLFAWRNLERSEASAAEQASYDRKVAAIASAADAGVLRTELPPADLLALVLALIGSWATPSPALRGLLGSPDDDGVRDRMRRSLHEAVSRLVAPT